MLVEAGLGTEYSYKVVQQMPSLRYLRYCDDVDPLP